jgi:hypothetical protein
MLNHSPDAREIRDDDTACRAITEGLAYCYGDRVYWTAGHGQEDLKEIEQEEHSEQPN